MKRWFIAVAILVGGAASFSYADYVLIRAVLGGRDPNNPNLVVQPNQPANPPGGPRGPRPPGGPRGPGGPGDPRTPPGGDGSENIPQLGLGAGQSTDIDTAALAVQAVVPVKRRLSTPAVQITGVQVTHKWSYGKGASRLFNDGRILQAFLLTIATTHARFEARKQGAFKGDRGKVLELAEWALAHGLYDEFAGLMDGLASHKEDETASNPPALKEAIKAYVAVKAALEKPSEGEVLAGKWRNRLSARMETSKHYAVIYTSPVNNPPEVQTRLAALENHMRAFYYWFAVRGHALPVPADKMVAVLLAEPAEFRKQRAVLEDEPLVSDGFYAHRDHICVFSAQRLDGPFQVFVRQTQPIWASGTYEESKLLDGTAVRRQSMTPPGEFARMMTLALLEKGLEDEAERAAVTHEGTRQLLVATGLMPRTVVPPQWVEFGSAAVFETPKGPFPGAPVSASVAIFPGVAGPSWAYLRPFEDMIKRLEGRPLYSPADLLKTVVTDGHFNQVITSADNVGLLRARSTAWALGYYLIKTRLPGMLRYYQELSALPRDLEMDGTTLLACFARAFDVANATQDGVDPAKFEQLAKDWVAYVKGLPVPAAELGLERELNTNPSGVPGAPDQPGAPGSPESPESPGGRPGPGRPSPGGPDRP